MFSSGSDTGHDNSGVSGPVLIPMRFVWPYGGRRVFLSGTFTRWTDHIPMSPMEGLPSVFQVIYSVSPGYHQFKFFVDGEWRHDERQPFVTGNYGVVNTVYLATENDEIPGIYNPETPGRCNMEVDNDMFLRLESVPRISEADINISRHRISVFLSTHTAYELLPESGKVVALDVNLPVKQAFHILYEQGIPVAPLWDFCKAQFVGVLSALDFILILKELGNHGSNLTEEELETHSILAWKEGKLHLNRQFESSCRAYPRSLIQAGPYDTLKDVASKILQNNVATVPVIHSSSQDASFPQLLHLASLSGILKCICRHFRHSSGSLPILQQPICSLSLGSWVPKIGEPNGQPFAMLRPNASLSAALSLLVEADVSSIPIVDDNDSLLDIYCRSDITALAKDRAYAQIRLEEMSINQALQLGQDVSSPFGFFGGQRCQMCLRSDSLHKVMERLANPGVRRLVIVEAGSKRVEGIVSLSDVFKFLLG
ncbi:sucrose nonfermenting 4-like protein [Rhododendron vialii]|uniref:sucrose nonfermenting 4-like protein n=1 Tax=Rhododendron vialii TaxID=182163 RepID=UPI00265ECB2C|nr:sucrose nonfermenting 4-like protein [Rhododendron vialii]